MITHIDDRLLIVTVNNELVEISLDVRTIYDKKRESGHIDKIWPTFMDSLTARNKSEFLTPSVQSFDNLNKNWQDRLTVRDESEILIHSIQSLGRELCVVYENGDIYMYNASLTDKNKIVEIPGITHNNIIIKSIINLRLPYVYGLCMTSQTELYFWKFTKSSSVICEKINLNIHNDQIIKFDVIECANNIHVIIYYELYQKMHTSLFHTRDNMCPCNIHKNDVGILSELSVHTHKKLNSLTHALSIDGSVYVFSEYDGRRDYILRNKTVKNLDKKISSLLSPCTLNAELDTKKKFKSTSILSNINLIVFPHENTIIESMHPIFGGIIMISKNKVTSYFINEGSYIFENLPQSTSYPKEITFFVDDPIVYVGCYTMNYNCNIYHNFVVTLSGNIYLWTYSAYSYRIIEMYKCRSVIDIRMDHNKNIKSAMNIVIFNRDGSGFQ